MKRQFAKFLEDYLITSLGEVVFIPTGKIRKNQIREGYPFIHIRGKNFSIHRLVAKYFIFNPNKFPIVNHIDNNRRNHSIENLEWCTQKHNIRQQLKLGTHTSQSSAASKKERFVAGQVSHKSRKPASGIKGIKIKIGPEGTRYLAYFSTKVKGSKYIGSFKTLAEAMEAYRAVHIEHYGIDPY